MYNVKCPCCDWSGTSDECDVEVDTEVSEYWGMRQTQAVEYWFCPECGDEVDDV